MGLEESVLEEDIPEHILAEALLERTEIGLEELMSSVRGRKHEHLAPEPEEALLALLGFPPDGRDCWQALARDLRGQLLLNEGLVTARAC